MLSLVTHHYFIFFRQEIWFHKNEFVNEKSYNVYCSSEVLPKSADVFGLEQFATIRINLQDSKDQIFAKFQPNVRNEIRRAEKEGIKFNIITKPSVDDCKMIVKSSSLFFANKSIKPISYQQILALKKENRLIITKSFLDRAEIATHVYLHDNSTVVLLYSFHNLSFEDHALRGFANKFLYWIDMMYFKEMSIHTYDFGGIDVLRYPGISKFKLSFGGQIEQRYRYIRVPFPLSIIMKFVKKLFGILKK